MTTSESHNALPPLSVSASEPLWPAAQVTIADIERAALRLSGHIERTPLLHSPVLDEAAGCPVYVKAEALQKTGAFKIRGALNKVLRLDADVRRRGVVAFSAGNHGLGVAAAARIARCPSVVILPKDATRVKIESCRWWASELVFYDPATEDREVVGRSIAGPRGMTLVPPFDDDDVIAGQGTVGLEICQQLSDLGVRPAAIMACCSGGGLASGITEAVRNPYPDIKVFVVEPAGYEKMGRSLLSGIPERNPASPNTIMDAIRGPRVGSRPLSILRRHNARGLSVTDDEALHAMSVAFRTLRIVLEPGGAAALAALLAGKAALSGRPVVVIASGGNVDPELFARALAL